jgi:4-hydroxybenzoate polyprenyltransferase
MVVVFSFCLLSYRIVPDLLLAAFLVTFSVYGLNRVTDRVEDSINRPERTTKPIFSLFPLVASMLAGLLIGLLEGLTCFIVLLSPLIIGLVYSVRLSKSAPRLKDVVGAKSFAVAASWALTGCLLPVSFYAVNLEKVVLDFVYIFIHILVGTILCDALDWKGDLIAGVETIPLRLGRKKTKKLLIIMNSFAVFWLVYCVTRGLFMQLMPALAFGCVYGYLAIWYFFKDRCRRLTADLMLDGEWLPIVLILSVFNK